jgi:GT2 family glycosyltransferase
LMLYDISVKKIVEKWDESYFLYYEDADFCERAKRKNIPLYYDPSIIIWHKNAQSTDGSGSSLHTKFQRINYFKFAMKYAPLRTKLHVLKNYFFTTIFSLFKIKK